MGHMQQQDQWRKQSCDPGVVERTLLYSRAYHSKNRLRYSFKSERQCERLLVWVLLDSVSQCIFLFRDKTLMQDIVTTNSQRKSKDLSVEAQCTIDLRESCLSGPLLKFTWLCILLQRIGCA